MNLNLTERELADFEADMAEQRAAEDEAWFASMMEMAPTVGLLLEALVEPVEPCRGCPLWDARQERWNAEGEAAWDAHVNR